MTESSNTECVARRKHNALANVPWQIRADIQEKIEEMPDSNRKTILRLYFVEERSSSEIVSYCELHGIKSRSHTFYSARSIQNIVARHFPEVRMYRRKNKDKEKRMNHQRYIREHIAVRCGQCGSEENLEWHHMIPISIGGETVEENMVCLCARCHRMVNAYHARLGLKKVSECVEKERKEGDND